MSCRSSYYESGGNCEGLGEPGEGCEAGKGCEPVVDEDDEPGAAELRSDEKACCRGDGRGGLTGLGDCMMTMKWLWGERECRY